MLLPLLLHGSSAQPRLVLVAGLLLTSGVAGAAISYTTPGAVYLEDFDGLPTNLPSNASIQAASGTYTDPYVNGWKDDSSTVAGDHIGVPGWYLYHPVAPASEGGANGNQRLRVGAGANTGGFWLFGASNSASEKALGSLGSTTVAANNANMYMGLRLVNDTGGTLTSFTLILDGEQWRDGQDTTGETLAFGYSLSATTSDWFSPSGFTAVPAGNFTSPVVAGTGSTGTGVNGNAEGRVANITVSVGGISWAPGGELWLRWGDPQLPTLADDGLAIDNVRFTAVPEPGALALTLTPWLLTLRRRRSPLTRAAS